jgi:hypothetical protein
MYQYTLQKTNKQTNKQKTVNNLKKHFFHFVSIIRRNPRRSKLRPWQPPKNDFIFFFFVLFGLRWISIFLEFGDHLGCFIDSFFFITD